VAIANLTQEERFVEKLAKYLVEHGKHKTTSKELLAIAKELECEDIEGFLKYMMTPGGKEFFRKTLRLELWKAGYRPKGWEL